VIDGERIVGAAAARQASPIATLKTCGSLLATPELYPQVVRHPAPWQNRWHD
jgi:hypothetical protein